MIRKIVQVVLYCLVIGSAHGALAEDESILEILSNSYPIPSKNAAQVDIFNHAGYDVICTMKISAVIQGRDPATGYALKGRSESAPVVGYILRAGRSQLRLFDFTQGVMTMRRSWNDPNAIVTEVDSQSLVADCKSLDSSGNESESSEDLPSSIEEKDPEACSLWVDKEGVPFLKPFGNDGGPKRKNVDLQVGRSFSYKKSGVGKTYTCLKVKNGMQTLHQHLSTMLGYWEDKEVTEKIYFD